MIVVAEGAGQKLMDGEAGTDASGNVLKKDIGEFLKQKISAHFKAKGIPSSVKYFDPSYMIRSVPARGTDAMPLEKFFTGTSTKSHSSAKSTML